MPLKAAQARKLAHTRTVTCTAFEREDELWDIEGRLVDIKPFDWINKDRDGCIAAGEPLHDMAIRLTIDLDFLIHDVDAVIDLAPQNVCSEISGSYKKLIGHHIGPGWAKLTKSLFGNISGCTHLRELLGPVASTSYQALVKPRFIREQAKLGNQLGDDALIFGSPEVVNTCHAWGASRPAVKEFWPDYYVPSEPRTN